MQETYDNTMDNWIPQRHSMRLIDRIIEVDDEKAVAEVSVPLDGLFTRDNEVPAWIGIEYMAQTVSAWAGAGLRREAGTPPKMGLLLGSRRFVAHRPAFPCGALLRIEARCELMGDNGLGMFDCRISLGDEELAHAKLAVFEPEDAAVFLKNAHPRAAPHDGRGAGQ